MENIEEIKEKEVLKVEDKNVSVEIEEIEVDTENTDSEANEGDGDSVELEIEEPVIMIHEPLLEMEIPLPIIIIMYYEWLRLFPHERHLVYELVQRDPKGKDGFKCIKVLDRVTAMEMIDKHGMFIVEHNRHGTVWEAPPEIEDNTQTTEL